MITLEIKEIGSPKKFRVNLHKLVKGEVEREIRVRLKASGNKSCYMTLFLIHRGITIRLQEINSHDSLDHIQLRRSIFKGRQTAAAILKATLPLVARWRLIERELPSVPVHLQ